MAHYKAEQDDWLIVYLKYLLFVFNFFCCVTTYQINVTALMGCMAKLQNPEQSDGADGPYLPPDTGRTQVLVGGHVPDLVVSTGL